MSIYMSRAELEEISEGLITAYANKFSNRVIQSIDIEHFITEFLMLRIEYASFAEDDAGRIGFLADGATPLLIHQDGKIIPFVFPKDTIVLDKFLLAEKEQGRRRFTMAHEASHHILSKMYAMPSEGRFHAEYDSERSYSKEELAQMFASVEWQADTMGASLLMPRRIIENALAKYNQSNPIRVYGDNTITSKDKAVIRRMAAYKIAKAFPDQIAALEQKISGYKSDIELREAQTMPNEDGFSSMEVEGTVYIEKKAAGSALLAAAHNMTSPDAIPIGMYRGFAMVLSFDTFAKEYRLNLKGQLSHPISLGIDLFGNIQRIDNMLAGLESDLQQCEAQLDNARVQLSNTKAAVDKPFPQEDELKTKLARLDELNILLNLDKRENEIVDCEPDESEPKEKKRDMER